MTAPADPHPSRVEPGEIVPRWRGRTEQAALATVTAVALVAIAWTTFRDPHATIDLSAGGRSAAATPGWRPAPDLPAPRGSPADRPAESLALVAGEPAPLDSTANGASAAAGSRADDSASERPTKKSPAARFQLDVNGAERAEWMQLPGIGPTLAARILESRERDGPFRTHDDLLRVSGIGPKTLAKLKPYLLPLPAPTE